MKTKLFNSKQRSRLLTTQNKSWQKNILALSVLCFLSGIGASVSEAQIVRVERVKPAGLTQGMWPHGPLYGYFDSPSEAFASNSAHMESIATEASSTSVYNFRPCSPQHSYHWGKPGTWCWDYTKYSYGIAEYSGTTGGISEGFYCPKGWAVEDNGKSPIPGTNPYIYETVCIRKTPIQQVKPQTCSADHTSPENGGVSWQETDFSDPRGTLSFTRHQQSGTTDIRHNFTSQLFNSNDAANGNLPPRPDVISTWSQYVGATVDIHRNFEYLSITLEGQNTGHIEETNANGTLTQFFAQDGKPLYANNPDRLTDISSGGNKQWQLLRTNDLQHEIYDKNGLQRIQSYNGIEQIITRADNGKTVHVTDSFNRQLSYYYDDQGNLSRLVAPDGSQTTYAYEVTSAGLRLTSVTYPDGSIKKYLWDEQNYVIINPSYPKKNLLTGMIDENGVRSITYQYDGSGRMINSEKTGGVDRFQYQYISDYSQANITDPLGAKRSYSFTNILGDIKTTQVSQPGGSGCNAASSGQAFDANGNTTNRTDFAGVKSCHAYDLTRNLETARLEGQTSCPTDVTSATISAANAGAQRKISTQWHPYWKLKTRLAEPKLITTLIYNGQPDPTSGNTIAHCAPTDALVGDQPIAVLCKKVEQPTTDETGSSGFNAAAIGTPRTTHYTYNRVGQILSEDGPRTDIADTTHWDYYADTNFTGSTAHTQGDLWKVTDPQGQVTEYTRYDQAGRILEMKDPNGILTQLSYSPRGWLTQRTVVAEGQTQTTLYNYDKVGQLTGVTQPDGSRLTYTYDDAHRLTDVTDTLGNTLHYTLDGAGNRIKEQARDPQGTLVRSLSRLYDPLGRLQNVQLAP